MKPVRQGFTYNNVLLDTGTTLLYLYGMLRKIIRRLVCNQQYPVEVFMSEKYNDNYYLRGQIHFIPEDFWWDENLCYFNYYLIILCLINDDFIKNKFPDDFIMNSERFPDFGVLACRTKDEYLDILKKYVWNRVEPSGLPKRKMKKKFNEWIKRYNKPLEINYANIKSFNSFFSKTSYLMNSLKNKNEIILYYVDTVFNGITGHTDRSPKFPKYFNRIHYSLGRHFSKEPVVPNIENMRMHYLDLYKELYSDFSYKKNFKEAEYRELLYKIGNLSYHCIKYVESKKPVSKTYIRRLFNFISKYRYERKSGMTQKGLNKEKRSEYDPLKEFCCRFFDDLLEEIIEHKFVKRCSNCENVFEYRKTKNWHNKEKDGRDCYQSHYQRILRKKRRSKTKNKKNKV